MSDEKRDQQLGTNRRITRRDFLNGFAVGIGALGYAGLPGSASSIQNEPLSGDDSGDSHPPALMGIRGSVAGSYDVAHASRDGNFWETAESPTDAHEAYDLVVG